MGATLLACASRVQHEGIVIHVVADLSRRLGRLTAPDAAPPTAHAAALTARTRGFH
jgi:hypothetical protein